MGSKVLAAIAVTLAAWAAMAGQAAAKIGIVGSAASIEVRDSPHRYVAISPQTDPRLTIVERIGTEDGRIDRWWHLRGSWYVPAVAFDGSAGGLSADGRSLVLSRFTRVFPPRRSAFAVLRTDLHLSHPLLPGQDRPEHAITRFALPGMYSFDSISPDGSRIYLTNHRISRDRERTRFEVRAVDTASGRLLPEPVVDPDRRGTMHGLPITRAEGADGRWAYTLYDGDGGEPFLRALDTVQGEEARVDLPQLRKVQFPLELELRLERGGERLVVIGRYGKKRADNRLLLIDTGTFAVRRPQPVASTRGGVGIRYDRIGRSLEGRPIELRQLGDPTIDGELLVFGCIHGDECGARTIQPTTFGCPDPHADIFVVPNLDPDGAADATRLNGRGVDLNRNFGSQWERLGRRWSPQYSGPRPFSEPETRLAARVIRELGPEATIWFHQHPGPAFVRAWGQSVPAARRFARLAELPFHRLPWPAGTGPNWQNHRFPGTSSFVVELPDGRLEPALKAQLGKAVVELGRWVGED